MISRNPRAFKFATPQQWQSCLMLGVDAQANGLLAWSGIGNGSTIKRPLPVDIALAFSCSNLLWREADGRIWRQSCSSETPAAIEGLHPLHKAEGVCINGVNLWIWAETGIALVDAKSLAVVWRLTMDGSVVALTVNEHGVAAALLEHGGRQELAIISRKGTITSSVVLSIERRFKQIVWARRDTVFFLAADSDALLEFDVQQQSVIRRIFLSTLVSCSTGIALARSGVGPVILLTRNTHDGSKAVVFLDGNGTNLGVVPMPEEATAVFPGFEKLTVTSGRNIFTYDFTPVDEPSTVETRAVILTPPLSIPQRPDEEGWRRMELEAKLPSGTRLEVAIAQISKGDDVKSVHDSWHAAVSPGGVASEFLKAIDAVTTAVFEGDNSPGPRRCSLQLPFAASLTLVFKVTLHSSLNAPAPVISSMHIVYGGRSLASRLPAVMLREDAKMGGFLASLMGLLDAASGDLDQAILNLDSKSDVQHAEETWLDEMAGWIGLPWHQRIPIEAKRSLLHAVPNILKNYGARSGLGLVLDIAIGDTLAEYEILDFTADFDIAVTASERGSPARLPMLLLGYPKTAAVLGRKAIIGTAKLPLENTAVDCGDIGAVVLIEISATAALKNELALWLPHLLTQMVPAHVELRIRWKLQKKIPEHPEPLIVSQSNLNAEGRLVAQAPDQNISLLTECLS